MATESQYPDAIIGSLTNLSGAVTDIDDDPDSPDGLWLTAPGSNSNTAVRVSFPTPSGTPNTGAGLQSFRVLVRKTNHSTDPTVSVALYETGGGTQLALVAETTVSSTTGVVVSGTWDATLLGTANGSAVEVQVSGTVGGGSPGNRASLEVGAIEWVVDYTPAVTERTAQADSVSTLTVSDATVTTTFPRTVGVSSASALHARWWTEVSGNSVAFDAAPTFTGTVEAAQTLTANDVVTYQSTVGVSSASTLTATATVSGGGTTYERTTQADGASTLTVERTLTRPGVVSISGASTLTVSDPTVTTTYERTTQADGASTFTAERTLTRPGVVAVTGASDFVATATVSGQAERTASPTGASTLTAERTLTRPGVVAVSSASTLTVTATVSGLLQRTAQADGVSALTVSDGGLTRNRAATTESLSALTVTRTLTRPGVVAVSSASALAVTATVDSAGTSQRTAAVGATGRLHARWYTSNNSIPVFFTEAPEITGTVAEGQTLTVSGTTFYEVLTGEVAPAGTSTLDVTRGETRDRTVFVEVLSSLSAVTGTTIPRTVSITAQSGASVESDNGAVDPTARSRFHARWYTEVPLNPVAWDATPTVSGTVAPGETLTANAAVTYQSSVEISAVSAASMSPQDPLGGAIAAISGTSEVAVTRTLIPKPPLSGGVVDTAPDPDTVRYYTSQDGTLYLALFNEGVTPLKSAIVAGGPYAGGSATVTAGTADVTVDLSAAPSGDYVLWAVMVNAYGGYSDSVSTPLTVLNPPSATFTGVSSLTVDPPDYSYQNLFVTFEAVGALMASGTVASSETRERTAQVSAQSSLTARASIQREVQVSAQSSLIAGTIKQRTVGVVAESSLTASITTGPVAVFRGASTMSATAKRIVNRGVTVSGTTTVTVSVPQATRERFTDLLGVSLLRVFGVAPINRNASPGGVSVVSVDDAILGELPDYRYAFPGDRPFSGRLGQPDPYSGSLAEPSPRTGKLTSTGRRSGWIVR